MDIITETLRRGQSSIALCFGPTDLYLESSEVYDVGLGLGSLRTRRKLVVNPFLNQR